MKTDFTTSDIVRALDIPRERLKDWMNHDFVRPSIPAPGRGIRAEFSRLDIYGIALFSKLLETGLNRKTAAEYVNEFIDSGNVETTAYILFQHEIKEGAYKVIATTFDAGNWKISLKTGGLDALSKYTLEADDPAQSVRGSENWDELVFINFQKLRQKVDRLLEALS